MVSEVNMNNLMDFQFKKDVKSDTENLEETTKYTCLTRNLIIGLKHVCRMTKEED